MDAFRSRVKANIEKTFRENNVNATVTIDANTKNISIHGKDMNAWIRLIAAPIRASVVNIVDVNNIQIRQTRQRKGIFTSMMRNLRELKTVNRIVITSVCTPEMERWCVKNGCAQIDLYDYRYK